MSEKYLIEAIKKKRREAIHRSDELRAEKFLVETNKKHKENIKIKPQNNNDNTRLLAVLLIIFLSVSITLTFMLINNDQTIQIIHQKEIVREKPIIHKITNINRTENIIKGEKQMVCLGKPDDDKIICYKQNMEE